jgi:lipopolysaccharide transport system ATP-binding protein
MSRPAISVENISKAYRIGLKEEKYPTFRDAMVNMAAAPLRRLRRLGGEGDRNGEDTFWALKDVSFEVQPGEVVGIIGRNGAGKSTLLKILSRITEPTAGEIRLRGRVASLLEVGTGFHPELTGRENIYLNGAILGMKRAEITRKFDEIVAFAEVEKFLDTPVKRYSSGMYVRLAFAVAAHLEPEILIVDEVLAVGDAEFQAKCLGKMQDVAQGQGRTVLFVSHNMAAIERLCSKSIVLAHGSVECLGSPTSCIRTYFHSGMPPSSQSDEIDCGDFRIVSVEVLDSEESVGHVGCFCDCRIKVTFIPNCGCRAAVKIVVETMTGQMLFAISTLDLLLGLPVASSEIIRCTFAFEALALPPGQYRLRTILRNESDFKSWESPRTHTFEVFASPIYGVRGVAHRTHGIVAVRAKVGIERPFAVEPSAERSSG